jgi:N-acetylneuraminic acid mutarotase
MNGWPEVKGKKAVSSLFLWCLLLANGLGACSAPAWSGEGGALPSMPAPRRAVGATLHNSLFYVTGGWNGQSTQLAAVEVYDPVRRTWRTAAPLRSPRSQHHLVSAAGSLWVVGGWSAVEGLVPAVERFNTAQGTWEVVTYLPTPRREPGVALWDGRIVVAGGFDGWSDADLDGYADVVEAYDPRHNTWQRLASLNQPRRGLSLVTVEGDLYALGGYTAGLPGFLSTVEQYDPDLDRWELLPWQLAPRTWAAAVEVDGDLVIAGGFNRSGFLDLLERVDPQTGAVCYPPPLASARSWFGAARLADGLLIVGGETAGGFSDALLLADVRCVEDHR